MAIKSALFSAISTVGANTSAYKIYLLIEQLSKDVNANTSQVRFYSYMVFTPGGNPTYNNYDGVNNYWLKVDDATVTSGTRRLDFRNSYTIVIADVTRTIAHDANGNKTVKGEAYQYIDDVSAWRYAQVSGSLTLETIPRASKFTASNVSAGAANIPITPTKSPAATTHNAKVMFESTVICDKDIGENPTSIPLTTAEWDIFYNLTKTVTAGSLVITLTTYNGTTSLGTDSKTITVTYASTDVPSFTSLTATETNATVSSVIAAYLQLLSKIKFTINGATGIKGSTISAYEIKFDTAVYRINNPVHTANKAGTFTASARVQDSRGRWSSAKTLSVTILSYSYPSITLFKVDRATSAGVIDLLGTYAKTQLSGKVASVLVGGVQKNNIRYKVDDVTSGTVNKVGTQTVLNTSITNLIHTFGTYPIDTVAILKLTLTDAFNQSVQYNISLSTADVPFTLGKYGVGIGGVVNNNLLSVLQVFGQSSFFGKVNFLDGIQPQSVNGLNMDTVTETGFYYGYNMTNSAVANKSIFEVYKYSPDWVVQTQYLPNSAGGTVYIRSRYSGTTWSPWKEFTVIVEKGSNSNGVYIRYADGTQICYGDISTINNAAGGVAFTFPAMFYGTNYSLMAKTRAVASGGLGAAYVVEVGANSGTTGVVKVTLHSPTTISGAVDGTIISYIAIGRWKA